MHHALQRRICVTDWRLQWVSDDVYDYHPLLQQPDPEAPEQSLGDCSICMDAILLEKDAGKSGLLAGASVKRSYALAPCHHLFVRTPSYILYGH